MCVNLADDQWPKRYGEFPKKFDRFLLAGLDPSFSVYVGRGWRYVWGRPAGWLAAGREQSLLTFVLLLHRQPAGENCLFYITKKFLLPLPPPYPSSPTPHSSVFFFVPPLHSYIQKWCEINKIQSFLGSQAPETASQHGKIRNCNKI